MVQLKSAYELGVEAAEIEFETGDRVCNPYDWNTQWIAHYNWELGFNDMKLSLED